MSERPPPCRVRDFASRGFLLPRAQRRRVPLVAPPRSLDRSRVGGGRRAPTGAVLRVLAPLDGFGCRTRHARTLSSPPFAVAPRRFAGLFHPARAPGVALQSFPFSRSRTRSRGPPASLRVRVRPAQRRGTNRGIRGSFPRRVDLLPRLARRLAGLEGRDDGSLESLGHCASPVAGLVCAAPSSRFGRARRIRRPARPLRSLAPLESPFLLTITTLARG